MSRRPLGCLSGTALVAAALALVGVVAAAAASGNGIFSPGRLNAEAGVEPVGGVWSHADLGQDCGQCHPAFWSGERMADRCERCHAGVREEMASGLSMHGGLASSEDCRTCHTDHRGAQSSLTRASFTGFPHERTGYLLWAHPLGAEGGRFECAACHPQSLSTFEARVCYECHFNLDPGATVQHRIDFGEGCLACHDGIDTYGHAFHHDGGAFQLLGKHQDLECVFCHQGATTLVALARVPTACVACHEQNDIHQTRLGLRCDECHSPDGWETAIIDHARTGFPLTGLHLLVACEDCHIDRTWVGLPTTCQSCHVADDPHGGQFAQDCSACHTTHGWADLIFDHDNTGFPLTPAHTGLDCADCHLDGQYAGTPARCAGCHLSDDAHAGRFGQDCEACHRPTRWSDAMFDHDRASFRLTGAHISVPCQDCHRGGTFAGTPSSCASCHNRPSSHGSAFSGSCGNCHSTSAWRPASFNGPHPFPMNHGGAGGNCSRCHPNSLTDYTCYGCHDRNRIQNQHREVTSNLGDCVRCHAGGRGGDD